MPWKASGGRIQRSERGSSFVSHWLYRSPGGTTPRLAGPALRREVRAPIYGLPRCSKILR